MRHKDINHWYSKIKISLVFEKYIRLSVQLCPEVLKMNVYLPQLLKIY